MNKLHLIFLLFSGLINIKSIQSRAIDQDQEVYKSDQQIIFWGIIDNENHFKSIVVKNMLKAKISFLS